eukprot:gb/GEZJ01012442.1/.p1 GENE.gb/GEZJ01012442.1/~~gb/GEZJ01012442.1/.p1  ORF type:complete len:118 (-),score=0.99 gb/GEZJ01012442.1/:16-369(-)
MYCVHDCQIALQKNISAFFTGYSILLISKNKHFQHANTASTDQHLLRRQHRQQQKGIHHHPKQSRITEILRNTHSTRHKYQPYYEHGYQSLCSHIDPLNYVPQLLALKSTAIKADSA